MHRRVSQYPISKLIYEAFKDSGLKASAFVHHLGYKSAARGAKRLDEWLLTGQGPAFLLAGLGKLVPAQAVIEALAATAHVFSQELKDSIVGRPKRRVRRTKPGVRHPCTCEHITTSVGDQKLHGIVYYYNSADLDVMITSPFDGINRGLHLPYFARGVFPEGYNGSLGYERAKQLLKAIYEEHKDDPKVRKN